MGEKVYGLLGRKLGHSWSAPIHAALGCADYRLIELEPEELGAFLAREDIGGLNVTIPYKRDVMAYCDVLDPMAEAIGISRSHYSQIETGAKAPALKTGLRIKQVLS